MRQTIHLIIFIAIAALLMVGCTGGSGTKHVPQASDTLYTEKAAMDVYAKEPERALDIIDSALIVGNVTKDRADLLRATVYSRAYEATRQDTAIVIGERLLNGKTAQDDVTFRQSVLEVLVYSARQLEDYELQLSYSTKLADAYRQQGDKVEALRTEAEIGAVLVRLGKTDEGLAKLDSVINRLTPVRKFNELDASIIAMKRKIGVIRDYPQIETTAQCIINRLDDFEQHPADFHDGSEREPADENRPGYIAFYRSQAWSYLAAAYAHLGEKGKAREYVALSEKSDLGQTLTGRKMIAPTLCLLGEYDKMETVYQELEAVFMERGDTLTIDYAQLLLDRAKAAEAQGRMKESTTLWQKHAEVLQKSEERLLQSKANLYAARYHAQEQQREIERKDAEAKHNALFAWFVAVIALLLACFAVYYYLRHREESRKNRILARQITEAMDYKDKYLESEKLRVKSEEFATATEQPDTPLESMSSEALFVHISQAIVKEQLFLDPAFDRQAAIDRFHLSKERIGAAFAQGSGYASITDFINECRLEYAVTLLRDQPSLPITHVAQASGFSDANYFGRKFKARFGLSPTDYRAGNS